MNRINALDEFDSGLSKAIVKKTKTNISKKGKKLKRLRR